MFGYHKAKRMQKKLKRAEEDLKNRESQYSADEANREAAEKESVNQRVKTETAQSQQDRKAARERGREYGEEFMSREFQGIDPEQKKMLQYEAQKQIKRAEQSANRKLLGDQATHGIVGKGGVGYAQQRDLMKMANEARGQAQRDLDKLDYDQMLKNKAALFAIEQGEASQEQLDKQIAMDQINLENEKKKQKYWEDQFNRNFSRV